VLPRYSASNKPSSSGMGPNLYVVVWVGFGRVLPVGPVRTNAQPVLGVAAYC
jgi:hypothetical protein